MLELPIPGIKIDHTKTDILDNINFFLAKYKVFREKHIKKYLNIKIEDHCKQINYAFVRLRTEFTACVKLMQQFEVTSFEFEKNIENIKKLVFSQKDELILFSNCLNHLINQIQLVKILTVELISEVLNKLKTSVSKYQIASDSVDKESCNKELYEIVHDIDNKLKYANNLREEFIKYVEINTDALELPTEINQARRIQVPIPISQITSTFFYDQRLSNRLLLEEEYFQLLQAHTMSESSLYS